MRALHILAQVLLGELPKCLFSPRRLLKLEEVMKKCFDVDVVLECRLGIANNTVPRLLVDDHVMLPTPVQPFRPVRIRLQSVGIANNHQAPACTCKHNIESTPVRQKSYTAGRIVPHCREHNELFLSALKVVNTCYFQRFGFFQRCPLCAPFLAPISPRHPHVSNLGHVWSDNSHIFSNTSSVQHRLDDVNDPLCFSRIHLGLVLLGLSR
mmetsp:Transcript_31368/g.72544  ORF Transcript_31368/g.72544 Transcript_31368/m.72544 type:complete len:210 (-) Transcript_31368:399-1028(-)